MYILLKLLINKNNANFYYHFYIIRIMLFVKKFTNETGINYWFTHVYNLLIPLCLLSL